MQENITLSRPYVTFLYNVKGIGRLSPIPLTIRQIAYYNVNIYNLIITQYVVHYMD
jgi:hypothetical protein